MVFRKFTYCISFFITCILLLHSFSGFAGNSVPIYEVFSYKEIEKEKEKGKKQKQEKLSEHTYKLGGNNSTSEVPISDFSKLTGMWHGEGFGGYCDENWGLPKDNLIHGVFRFFSNDGHVFSELMMITIDSLGWALKLKHFNPDLTGWEEKDEMITFRFIKSDDKNIYFRGLTYSFPNENELIVYLALSSKDGKVREEEFKFKRVE